MRKVNIVGQFLPYHSSCIGMQKMAIRWNYVIKTYTAFPSKAMNILVLSFKSNQ